MDRATGWTGLHARVARATSTGPGFNYLAWAGGAGSQTYTRVPMMIWVICSSYQMRSLTARHVGGCVGGVAEAKEQEGGCQGGRRAQEDTEEDEFEQDFDPIQRIVTHLTRRPW